MKFKLKPLRHALAGTLVVAVAATLGSARADDRESLETLRQTTLNLIEALVDQGVFSRAKADALVQAAQAKAAAATAAVADKPKGAPVRVQYVPETVRNEIREQLKQEVIAQARAERWAEPNAVPAWVDRIQWEGDVRVRSQTERYARDNATPQNYITAAALGTTAGTTRAAGFLDTGTSTGPTANTGSERERLRLRMRLGLLAKVSDDWSAGVRLATGQDRVSTNQTLGQDFNKYSLYLDRAYVKYAPLEWLSLSGGRIPNPWLSTDLVWSENLNFEGVAATLKPTLGDGRFRPFLTVGAFPLKEENQPRSSGRWLRGAQAGAKWDLDAHTRLTFGAAWYDFDKLEGRPDGDPGLGAVPAFGQYEYGTSLRQKGNTLFLTDAGRSDGVTPGLWGLAARFRPATLTGSLDLGQLDPVHVILTGEYVKNTAFDREEIRRRTGHALTDGKDYGYLYRIAVGMPRLEKRHDWNVAFTYRYLGSDAVVDAFTDSDFGLGGTNLKGYILGLNYGLDPNASIGLRWLSAESIDAFSLNPAHRYAVDVLQADVNVRF